MNIKQGLGRRNGTYCRPEVKYSKPDNFQDFSREKFCCGYKKWIEFDVLHGATDTPAVDVLVNGAGLNPVDNLSYGEFTDYLRVKAMAYTPDMTPAENNNTVAASYLAKSTGDCLQKKHG